MTLVAAIGELKHTTVDYLTKERHHQSNIIRFAWRQFSPSMDIYVHVQEQRERGPEFEAIPLLVSHIKSLIRCCPALAPLSLLLLSLLFAFPNWDQVSMVVSEIQDWN